jgi:hypothetical protein
MRRILTMNDQKPVIVFALFPGVTQLDLTGPHEVFSSLPGASVILASTEGGMIEATGGMTFAGLRRLDEIPECDVVCVPGGARSRRMDRAQPKACQKIKNAFSHSLGPREQGGRANRLLEGVPWALSRVMATTQAQMSVLGSRADRYLAAANGSFGWRGSPFRSEAGRSEIGAQLPVLQAPRSGECCP